MLLAEKVIVLLENIKPEALSEIEGTLEQSLSEKWFGERWFRVTTSKCLPAFKIGRLIMDSRPNVAAKCSSGGIQVYFTEHSGPRFRTYPDILDEIWP